MPFRCPVLYDTARAIHLPIIAKYMQYLSGISEANWVIYKNLFLWSINTRGPVHVDGSESKLRLLPALCSLQSKHLCQRMRRRR